MIICCINYNNIESHPVHPDVIDLYSLICVSPSIEKANQGCDLQLFQFSGSPARRQLQEQQHQAGFVAAAAADPS